MSNHRGFTIVEIVLVVVVVAIIGLVGYVAYNQFFGNDESSQQADASETGTPTEITSAEDLDTAASELDSLDFSDGEDASTLTDTASSL